MGWASSAIHPPKSALSSVGRCPSTGVMAKSTPANKTAAVIPTRDQRNSRSSASEYNIATRGDRRRLRRAGPDDFAHAASTRLLLLFLRRLRWLGLIGRLILLLPAQH